MGSFNRGGGGPRRDFGRRDSGRSGFGDRGGGRFGRDRNRGGDREMFSAVCSNCGKDCQVPFRPTGSKPVYCSDCFEKQGGGERERRFDDRGPRDNFEKRNNSQPQNNAQMESIERKLDRILEILTKPQVSEVKTPEVEVKPEPTPEETPTIKKPRVSKKKTPAKEA